MRTVVLALVVVVLSACGGIGGRSLRSADLTGRLGGDRQLEGGCAWLDPIAGGERVEPQWPAGYRVEFGPLRLVGPDGQTIAEEGDAVRVNGEVADDAVSICQVGPVFEVSEVLHDPPAETPSP